MSFVNGSKEHGSTFLCLLIIYEHNDFYQVEVTVPCTEEQEIDTYFFLMGYFLSPMAENSSSANRAGRLG